MMDSPQFKDNPQATDLSTSVFSQEVPGLLQSHLDHLLRSGISLEVIKERGYTSALGKRPLADLGFASYQQKAPALVLPIHGVSGGVVGYQCRPDTPRLNPKGKPIKYESCLNASNRLDCPPRCQASLGDPAVPLFIPEGVKKGDSLATAGACAIALAGVWSWRGKNEAGGLVALPDWDAVAFNGRTLYLAFDSDTWTNPQVKAALLRLTALLGQRGAKVLIVHLPPAPDGGKVGVDDYLAAGHTLANVVALAVPLLEPEAEKAQEHPVPGFVLPDAIGEMVVGADGVRRFAIFANGQGGMADRWPAPGGGEYVPTQDPLVGRVVHFAACAKPYDSQATLYEAVRAHIHTYLDVTAEFEQIAALYVLLCWVYDYVPALPYLRALGDWGSGKSRLLQVVGEVCFRPIFASGATTPSPIFRLLAKFRGTLILDEGDFKDSNAWAELVKILNNGYKPGFPVLRAVERDRQWEPEGFEVFGPKLVATRSRFQDEALESRCLTIEMMPTARPEIPRALPRAYPQEVANLRGQLLTFRLLNLHRMRGKEYPNSLVDQGLQPRLQELLLPLRGMVDGEAGMAEVLTAFILHHQESLLSRRRESKPGRVLAALLEILLALTPDSPPLTVGQLTDRVNTDPEANMTSQAVGWQLKKLGIQREREAGSGARTVVVDPEHLGGLASLYGLPYLPPPGPPPSPAPAPAPPPPLPPENSSLSSLSSQPDMTPHCDELPDEFQPGEQLVTNSSQAKPLSGRDKSDKSDMFSGGIGDQAVMPCSCSRFEGPADIEVRPCPACGKSWRCPVCGGCRGCRLLPPKQSPLGGAQ